MEENEIDIDVIEREEEGGKPTIPGASKRKIIFITAISLFVFLVVVASISTFIALSVSLSGNDNGESESNDVPAPSPSPSPSTKPSSSSKASPSPIASPSNLHLPSPSNSPLPSFSRPQNDPEPPIDLDAWYGNDGIEEGKDVPPEPSPKDEPLRYTSEYQITLRPKIFRYNRTAVINEMLGIVTQFTGLPFDFDNGSEAIRVQHVIDGARENCTAGVAIRVRDYVTGPKTGGTTVDIKGNSGTKIQESVDFPYFPGPAFPDFPHSEPEGNPGPASFQKVEKDVHDCGFKYSRETRIFFQYPPAIETCHDLLHLYPWIFPNLPVEKQSNKLSSSGTEVWWVLEHSAYLVPSPGSSLDTDHPNVTSTEEGESDPTPDKTGTRCESTFTLQYNNLQDAFNDGDPQYGEWSLRIYRTDDGLGSWDPLIVSTVDELYAQMLQIFVPTSSC